jgi:hypothetical protein
METRARLGQGSSSDTDPWILHDVPGGEQNCLLEFLMIPTVRRCMKETTFGRLSRNGHFRSAENIHIVGFAQTFRSWSINISMIATSQPIEENKFA